MKDEEFDDINDDEEIEVDVLEFSMNEDDINEMISKLEELRETRKSVEYDIDDRNQLLINFEDYEDEEEGDGEDEEDYDEDEDDLDEEDEEEDEEEEEI